MSLVMIILIENLYRQVTGLIQHVFTDNTSIYSAYEYWDYLLPDSLPFLILSLNTC